MTLIIILLVILLTMAFFHLKCSLMQSICTLWFAVFSTILAFAYYETVAGFVISYGYGIQFAHAACFMLIFLLGFAVLKAAGEYIIGANIDLGPTVKLITGLVCGFLCGMIIAGNLLVAIGMVPVQKSYLYSRFDPEGTISINNAKKPALNVDGFAAGLFKMVSNGSMRSHQSFAVFHPNFISQNHLNRLKVNEKVTPVCGTEALTVPKGENIYPIRHWKTLDDDVVLVRMEISGKPINEGGANDASGQITFIPGQIRLVYTDDANLTKDLFLGKAKVVYPVGILTNNQLEKKELSDVIDSNSGTKKGRQLSIDMAFELPQGVKPLLLQFKQGGIADLTSYEVVERTEETERALNSAEATL